jgi:hypothetical protein
LVLAARSDVVRFATFESGSTSTSNRWAAAMIFLAGALLGGLALELGLVPAGHGVADVGGVVDREVLPALLVDVCELAAAEPFASLGVERWHV